VLELLRGLCRERGVAVGLVSHDPLAGEYADRVLALRDGQLSGYQSERGTVAQGQSDQSVTPGNSAVPDQAAANRSLVVNGG
jgi:ABC-type glutathione transport system ATPase component